MTARIKRRKVPKSNIPRTVRRKYDSHRQFVRGFECAVAGRVDACQGRIECAHVRTGTDAGAGMVPSDWWTIPLCAFHHVPVQHQKGEAAFERLYGIDMKAVATSIARASRNKAIRICAGRRAEDISLEELET